MNDKEEKIMQRTVLKISTILVLSIIGIFLFTACSQPNVTPEPLSVTNSRVDVRNVPASYSTISLTVEGEGMETIAKDIDAGKDKYTLEVPSGDDRTFVLTMANETSTFGGSTTTDLEAGTEQNLTIALELDELELLIPDPVSGDSRLIQIDDISGSDWKSKQADNYSSLDTNELLTLGDLDYDEKGRIYTMSTDTSTTDWFIRRLTRHGELDNSFKVASPTGEEIRALAVDRVDNHIYFGYVDINAVTHIGRVDYNGDNLVTYSTTFPSGTELYALAVDRSGQLYIGLQGDGADLNFKKFDPTTDSIIAESFFSIARDVFVSGDYVYVAGNDFSNEVVARYPLNFDSDTLPQKLTTSPDETDFFFGPWLFLPTTTGTLYIYDDDTGSGDGRIIKVENIQGDGWTVFEASDVGETGFDIAPLT
jgi:hypothetical protein